MTDQEMERYLVSRARALPVPPPCFSRLREGILQQEEARGRRRRSPVKRLVIACAIMVALTIAAAAGFTSYQLIGHVGCIWPATAAGICSKYDVQLPEQLVGYPLGDTSYVLVVPRGTSLAAALLKQTYRRGSVEYGTENSDHLHVAIGSTKNPYWASYFSYDPETLEWTPGSGISGTKYTYLNQTTMEYGGQILYLYDTWAGNIFIFHTVTWVDTEQCVCWEVSGDSTAEALSAAKELIDANR